MLGMVHSNYETHTPCPRPEPVSFSSRFQREPQRSHIHHSPVPRKHRSFESRFSAACGSTSADLPINSSHGRHGVFISATCDNCGKRLCCKVDAQRCDPLRLHTIARRAKPRRIGFARQAFEAHRTPSSVRRYGQIMPPAKSAYNPRSSGTDRSSCPHCLSRSHSDRLTADHGSVCAWSSDNSGRHTTHHVR